MQLQLVLTVYVENIHFSKITNFYAQITQNILNLITDSNICPVNMFEFYVLKLNKRSNRLWQRPRQGTVFYADEEWYEQRHLGHHTLESFMETLITDAELI